MCPLLERTSTCRALASFNQFFMAPIFRSEPETILRLSSFKNFPVKALPPLLIRSKGERILQTEREEESKVKLRSKEKRPLLPPYAMGVVSATSAFVPLLVRYP
ncbi:hypothetical protein MRB53_034461 [Persea americana]|uniref:Uncharacterized protein n=1 Tax=Persea americana TaxID=3435 RepID=A0ACC2K261_PERAE|nr:hypothetical protein MRB53_034461 [Persea americana]